MNYSNIKKAQQLGMPHGTAQGRLRKSIIFHLVQQLNQNICYRCGEVIHEIEELSIDHKIDWLNSDNPLQLFFDLNNIVFSHLHCNTAYLENKYQGPSPRRKIGTLGTSWCSKCKAFLPVMKFYKDSRKWTGCASVCKSHSEIAKGRKVLSDYPELVS